MKLLSLLFLSLTGFSVLGFAHSEVFNAKLVAKLNAYVAECGAPGADPKPKMAEFVAYLQANGFKDAKVECGVSHFEGTTPVMRIHAADGSEYTVNFRAPKRKRKPEVSDAIVDAPTPFGTKRKVVWPISGKDGK